MRTVFNSMPLLRQNQGSTLLVDQVVRSGSPLQGNYCPANSSDPLQYCPAGGWAHWVVGAQVAVDWHRAMGAKGVGDGASTARCLGCSSVGIWL